MAAPRVPGPRGPPTMADRDPPLHEAQPADGATVRAPWPRRAVRVVPAATVASLRLLAQLRWIAIGGQVAALAVAAAAGAALPWLPLAAVVAALVVLNVATAMRVRRARPVTHAEVAAHLLADLAAFTALIALTGGGANPFVWLYVLHGVLAGQLLPWPLFGAGLLAVLACYAAGAASPWPLALRDGAPLPSALVTAGSHVSFVLTAALSTWFVARIAALLRQHEQLLREAAASASRDECVLRVGALAAGAAHELASPLTTMAAIVDEMAHEDDPAALRRDAATIAAQVDACRRTVQNLTAAAAHAAAAAGARVPLDRFVEAVVARCQALRPDATLTCRWDGALPVPAIADDGALEQTMLILLNNAVDASADDVGMLARWDPDWLEVAVTDRGPGVPAGARARMGRVFYSTKPPGKGTGLGLVLAADTVRRLGGTLEFADRAGGGMRVELRVPLAALGT